jgi:hypothetical protein
LKAENIALKEIAERRSLEVEKLKIEILDLQDDLERCRGDQRRLEEEYN